MSSQSETQVFLDLKMYLVGQGWCVLGGQPPSGTDELPVIEIRDPLYRGRGSKGCYKPDLVAWSDYRLHIIELKPTYDSKDRSKVQKVLSSPERIDSLWESLIERKLKIAGLDDISSVRSRSVVVGGLGYGGTRVSHPDLWRFFVEDGQVEVTPGTFLVPSS